jgi:hypothetical protein
MSRVLIHLVVTALACVPVVLGQDTPDTLPWRLLRASEAEQIEAFKAALDRGLPPDDGIVLLTINRSTVVLPLLEKKIEDYSNHLRPWNVSRTRL